MILHPPGSEYDQPYLDVHPPLLRSHCGRYFLYFIPFGPWRALPRHSVDDGALSCANYSLECSRQEQLVNVFSRNQR